MKRSNIVRSFVAPLALVAATLGGCASGPAGSNGIGTSTTKTVDANGNIIGGQQTTQSLDQTANNLTGSASNLATVADVINRSFNGIKIGH